MFCSKQKLIILLASCSEQLQSEVSQNAPHTTDSPDESHLRFAQRLDLIEFILEINIQMCIVPLSLDEHFVEIPSAQYVGPRNTDECGTRPAPPRLSSAGSPSLPHTHQQSAQVPLSKKVTCKMQLFRNTHPGARGLESGRFVT